MTRFVRVAQLHEERVGAELVALDVENGKCFGMNAVATRVWELLANPVSVEELCGVLTDEYDIDDARCRSQVVELLDQLQTDKLASQVS